MRIPALLPMVLPQRLQGVPPLSSERAKTSLRAGFKRAPRILVRKNVRLWAMVLAQVHVHELPSGMGFQMVSPGVQSEPRFTEGNGVVRSVVIEMRAPGVQPLGEYHTAHEEGDTGNQQTPPLGDLFTVRQIAPKVPDPSWPVRAIAFCETHYKEYPCCR